MEKIENKIFTVDGIMVIPDHNEMNRYSYVPINPKLSIKRDKKSGFVYPGIELIKFRSKEVMGGIFKLDVNFDLEDNQIEKIRKTIIREHNLEGDVHLHPVTFDDGFVRMVIHGVEGDEPIELAYSNLLKKNHLSLEANLDVNSTIIVEKTLMGENNSIVLLFSLDYDIGNDEKRTIFPQLFLKDLLSPIFESSFDPTEWVHQLDLGAQIFEGRKLEIVNISEFDSDIFEKIEVNLNYEGSKKTVVLNKENREKELHWPGKLKDGKMIWNVTVSYTIWFNVDMNQGLPAKISSDEQIVYSRNYMLNPYWLLSRIDISIKAVFDDWDKYSSVVVLIKYSDHEREINIENSSVLTPENLEEEIKFIVPGENKRHFNYKIIYKSKGGIELETPWIESENSLIIVGDPP